TTFMTGPALDVINYFFKHKEVPDLNESLSKNYKILISFANPKKGKILLRLANQMIGKSNGNEDITLLHLSPNDELNQLNIQQYERDSFAPVLHESKILNQKVQTIFKVSNDIKSDIPEIANKGEYDILLVGLGRSIYEGSLLGKIIGFTSQLIVPDKIISSVTRKEKWFEKSPFEESTRQILSKSEIPVGILIDKNYTDINKILLLVYDINDMALLNYAYKFLANSNTSVIIYDSINFIHEPEILQSFKLEDFRSNGRLKIVDQLNTDKETLLQNELLIISIDSWKNLVQNHSVWLVDAPSTLIIKQNAKNPHFEKN
ncbi:MAG: hypothetical protein M0P66_11030, partial [Salinivirgaceae bacterium]|nr:hypothetical protein [Salinivirgaceae bacterium]